MDRVSFLIVFPDKQVTNLREKNNIKHLSKDFSAPWQILHESLELHRRGWSTNLPSFRVLMVWRTMLVDMLVQNLPISVRLDWDLLGFKGCCIFDLYCFHTHQATQWPLLALRFGVLSSWKRSLPSGQKCVTVWCVSKPSKKSPDWVWNHWRYVCLSTLLGINKSTWFDLTDAVHHICIGWQSTILGWFVLSLVGKKVVNMVLKFSRMSTRRDTQSSKQQRSDIYSFRSCFQKYLVSVAS